MDRAQRCPSKKNTKDRYSSERRGQATFVKIITGTKLDSANKTTISCPDLLCSEGRVRHHAVDKG